MEGVGVQTDLGVAGAQKPNRDAMRDECVILRRLPAWRAAFRPPRGLAQNDGGRRRVQSMPAQI
jgi:hypothetical protein